MTPPDHHLPATLPPGALATPIDADLHLVPALIADSGEPAAWRYIEFFTAHPQSEHAPGLRAGL